MKYQPRFQECPYKTANGKCVHKHIKNRVSKRKRFCGYNKLQECDMYCEWLEIRKVEERASEVGLKLNHRRSGND